MSSKKTTNLGLHLWESGDKFLRTEFNENSTKLDTAVKNIQQELRLVKLADITTTTAKTQVDLNLSGVNLTDYMHLELYGETTIWYFLRVNGLPGPYYGVSGGSGFTSGGVALAHLNGAGMGTFRFNWPSPHTLVGGWYQRMQKESSGASCNTENTLGPITWAEVTSINFVASNNGATFPAGSRFILMGIRK